LNYGDPSEAGAFPEAKSKKIELPFSMAIGKAGSCVRRPLPLANPVIDRSAGRYERLFLESDKPSEQPTFSALDPKALSRASSVREERLVSRYIRQSNGLSKLT
jgi:hypothetical protein